MSNLSVAFIRASILYLFLGITIGVIMAFPGGHSWLNNVALGNPTTAHAHALLLGFMMMMVAGVGYHIFPRFTGNPVRRPWMAWGHFWASQVGTTGMVTGFLCYGLVPWLLPVAAVSQVIGLTLFGLNMWQVVRPLRRLMPM